jgi:HTH-type transcriptional regulator / antitoxin HigA
MRDIDKNLIPAEVFPPGEHIKEELEARGWSQADLAEIIGRPVQVVNEILAAKKIITPDTARELAAAFDVHPQLFLNLENAFRLSLSKTETSEVARRAAVYAKAPIRELIKRGWITGSKDIDLLERQVCDFLGIPTIDEEPSCFFAARKSDGYEGYSQGQVAWFCRCRHLAQRLTPAGEFDEVAFPRLLTTLPREFANEASLEQLPEFLSRHGLVLVLLEHLPGTKIDGGAFWVQDRPVVALSVRYDRVDAFWYTLMHELAHVVLHGRKHSGLDLDLVGPSAVATGTKPVAEQDADRQASEWLVPPDELTRFITETRPYYSHDRIVRFAKRMGVHTGVVVGQLQHRREIGWGHSRKFLVKVRHILPMEN